MLFLFTSVDVESASSPLTFESKLFRLPLIKDLEVELKEGESVILLALDMGEGDPSLSALSEEEWSVWYW